MELMNFYHITFIIYQSVGDIEIHINTAISGDINIFTCEDIRRRYLERFRFSTNQNRIFPALIQLSGHVCVCVYENNEAAQFLVAQFWFKIERFVEVLKN